MNNGDKCEWFLKGCPAGPHWYTACDNVYFADEPAPFYCYNCNKRVFVKGGDDEK